MAHLIIQLILFMKYLWLLQVTKQKIMTVYLFIQIYIQKDIDRNQTNIIQNMIACILIYIQNRSYHFHVSYNSQSQLQQLIRQPIEAQIQTMFKDSLGSPRFNPSQVQQNESILSPRNFLKFITNSIDQVRKATLNAPNRANYQQFLNAFNPYLSNFQEEYKKYKNNKIKKIDGNQKNQELQMELKISKIPSKYFVSPHAFVLQLYKRTELRKKQQELTQYLDQIEVVLFAKSGKYPQKSAIILNNIEKLEFCANSSIEKVCFFRKGIKQKIMKSSQQQLKVKNIHDKMNRINKVIEQASLMKKMHDLKLLSQKQKEKNASLNQQFLLNVKKSQLQACNKFTSLKKVLINVENYRCNVKDKIYKEFIDQIEVIFNKLLKYNKNEWKNINIPQSIFVNQGNQNNISHNNITVLDQSYFAFDSNPAPIIKKSLNSKQPYAIDQQNEEQEIDLGKLYELWSLLKQFDLYDVVELNESLFRVLVKHNTAFNQDMHDYVTYLSDLLKRENNNVLNSVGRSYADLKSSRQNSAKEEDNRQNESNEQRLSSLDMKLFVKVAKFYFHLIKKIISLINNNKELIFLVNFKVKLCQFIQSRISYFVGLKKITHQIKNQDFFSYLQIIFFWENEQFYEIEQFCENLKCAKIQEYLTSIQTNLLLKEIKQTIESSTYLPVSISSSHYMTFHNLLSPNDPTQDEANMSMTIIQEGEQKNVENGGVLRLINKTIFYKNKIYKICDSFLEIIRHIERYVKLKESLSGFEQNIEEKICELIGFYVWYNQRNLTNNKNGAKTLKNYCTFFSTLLFLKNILPLLLIVNKKIDKTNNQLSECQNQISSTITMTPFMMIEQKISQLYESRISTRAQVPTPQTQRIIDIIKISMDCLKEYFPIQYEERINQSLIFKFMQTTIKLVYKNYFGYLANMEKRGISQIKWLLPKLKEILEVTMINNSNIVDKKGELLCKNGASTFYVFNDEIQEMQKLLKSKSR